MTIGGDVLAGLNAVDIAEKDFQGLVIGNQGANFSVGANIGMIFMMAVEQEYDELTWLSSISRHHDAHEILCNSYYCCSPWHDFGRWM